VLAQDFSFRRIQGTEELLRLIKFSYANNQTLNESRRESMAIHEKNGVLEIYGVFLGDQLISSCFLYPFVMRFRGAMISAGGIGTVASNPVHRGKGSVRYLLEHSVRAMTEKGMKVSVLYPFQYPFYEKYGWGRFSDAFLHRIDPSEILHFPNDSSVQLEEYQSPLPEITEFYNVIAQREYNRVLMTPEMWQRELSNPHDPSLVDERLVVFRRQGAISGMLHMSMYNQNGQEEVPITYLVAQDAQILRQIFRFLGGLSMQLREIRLYVPQDFPISNYLMGRTIQTVRKEQTMIRVHRLMDLNGLTVELPDRTVCIRLKDSILSENSGEFQITVHKGVLWVEKGRDPQLECSMALFSSALSGFTTFQEALDAGRATALVSNSIESFPKEMTYFPYDF